jgi:hypothetical protein
MLTKSEIDKLRLNVAHLKLGGLGFAADSLQRALDELDAQLPVMQGVMHLVTIELQSEATVTDAQKFIAAADDLVQLAKTYVANQKGN